MEGAGIKTIDETASSSLKSIPKLSKDILDRLKAQAEMQILSEDKDKPSYKILPHDGDRSLGVKLPIRLSGQSKSRTSSQS